MNTNVSMYELISNSAVEYPDSWAYKFMGQGAKMPEFIGQIDLVAASLSRLGVKNGSVVSVCLPNTPHALIVFYAINKLGAIANMIHPLTPTSQLIDFIKNTNSKWLFLIDLLYKNHMSELKDTCVILCSIPDYLEVIKGIAFNIKNRSRLKGINHNSNLIRWRDLFSNQKDNAVTQNSDPSACAVYLHSGGTTGSPKTIMLSSKAFNELAIMGLHMAGLESIEGKKMLAVLPLFHGFGLGVCVHTMLANGGGSVLVPKFSPNEVVKIIQKEKPSLMAGVPTMFEALLNSESFTEQDLSCIEAAFCGGDSLPLDLKLRFDNLLRSNNSKAEVMEGYGLTETVTVCCVNTPKDNCPGSVGKPNPNMMVKVISTNNGQVLTNGEDGELCFSGATQMLGYYDDIEGTDYAVKADENGQKWVHTGDYGCVDENGFVWFKQRLKRIIKSSGVAVFPSEIEDCVCSVDQVSLACAIGIPDKRKIEVVKVFVLLNKGISPSDEIKEKILNKCKEKLIKWAIPAFIEFRDEMPLTLIGKVDYHALEEQEKLKE